MDKKLEELKIILQGLNAKNRKAVLRRATRLLKQQNKIAASKQGG